MTKTALIKHDCASMWEDRCYAITAEAAVEPGQGRGSGKATMEVVSRLKLKNEWDVKETNHVPGTESSMCGSHGTGKSTGP